MSLNVNLSLLSSDVWYGFRRRIFQFGECEAWLVEPEQPAPGMPWTWCMEWPDAFVKRTGVPDLLARGFHHVHLAFKERRYGNDESLAVYREYHTFLRGLGLAEKAKLIGLSFGGLYCLRYASEYPEMIERIYLDAPVCTFHNFHHLDLVRSPYAIPEDYDAEHDPRMPLNRTDRLAGIPMLLIYGADDLVVSPRENCELLLSRLRERGASIRVIRRPSWGHHPHGLDEPEEIVSFLAG